MDCSELRLVVIALGSLDDCLHACCRQPQPQKLALNNATPCHRPVRAGPDCPMIENLNHMHLIRTLLVSFHLLLWRDDFGTNSTAISAVPCASNLDHVSQLLSTTRR
jgi:hypothetical protein